MLHKDSPAPSKRQRGRADEPSLLAGPDALSGDMSGADLAYVLGHIRFRNGLQTIALDKAARDYLLDAVVARIGGRSR
jgi:hypothetical protein